MNRILLTFFVVLTVSLKAQSYTFDKVVTYQMNGNAQNQNIINSKNDNYALFLKVGNIAELFDRTTKVKHFFKVSYQANDKISFEYLRSCDESQYWENIKPKKWDYRIERINDNEFILAKYKSERSKKAKYEIIIKIEESEIGHFNLLHTIEDEFIDKLKPFLDNGKNYTIKEMNFSTGYCANILKLKNAIEYDLKVELPKNLIYKCEYPVTSIVINNF